METETDQTYGLKQDFFVQTTWSDNFADFLHLYNTTEEIMLGYGGSTFETERPSAIIAIVNSTFLRDER